MALGGYARGKQKGTYRGSGGSSGTPRTISQTDGSIRQKVKGNGTLTPKKVGGPYGKYARGK
jgi:hypothetical protein